MDHRADEVLDYATPTADGVGSRWSSLVGGVVLGEVTLLVLWWVLLAGGPIFPFTVVYAPAAVIVEGVRTELAFRVGLFVGGPALYGFYGLLLAMPNRWRNLSIATAVHLACFAVTLGQREVSLTW